MRVKVFYLASSDLFSAGVTPPVAAAVAAVALDLCASQSTGAPAIHGN